MDKNPEVFTAADALKEFKPVEHFPEVDVTWEQLIKIEPDLIQLEKLVKSVRGTGKNFCANRVWYGEDGKHVNFRERVTRLAG